MTRIPVRTFEGMKRAESLIPEFKRLEALNQVEREQWWVGFMSAATESCGHSIGRAKAFTAIAAMISAYAMGAEGDFDAALAAAGNLRRDILKERATRDAKQGRYRCAVCLEAWVTPADGQDTCDGCLARV